LRPLAQFLETLFLGYLRCGVFSFYIVSLWSEFILLV
jgi:hypothetical protein